MGFYLEPTDLKANAPDQCWNPDCSNYSEEHPSCCTAGYTDEECEERYQLSDYGKSVSRAAADHAGEEIVKWVKSQVEQYGWIPDDNDISKWLQEQKEGK